MPFVSKKQWKKCFVSKGFGGKVDCGEWARKTKKKYKKLPETVEESKTPPSFSEWLRHRQTQDEDS